MQDVQPYQAYFRYTPSPESPTTRAFTPFIGEVDADRIYVVTEAQAALLAGHPEWEKVTKTQYNAQQRADAKSEDEEPAEEEAPSDDPAPDPDPDLAAQQGQADQKEQQDGEK